MVLITHRQIYKHHFGEIPKDEDGRSYDVHHKDGNHNNNDPSNLIALSIEEHYRVHLSQGDYGAAMRIIARKNVRPELLSELARLAQIERYKNPDERLKRSICMKKMWEDISYRTEMTMSRGGENHFFYGKKRPEHSALMKQKMCKYNYLIEEIDTATFHTTNSLSEFCRTKNLQHTNLLKTDPEYIGQKRKQHKGFRIHHKEILK